MNEHKNTTTFADVNAGPGLEQRLKCGVINWLMRSNEFVFDLMNIVYRYLQITCKSEISYIEALQKQTEKSIEQRTIVKSFSRLALECNSTS